VLGTMSWYFATLAIGGRAAVGYVVPVSVAWSCVAALAGAGFGFAGALWRASRPELRAVSVALLAGALAGEAMLLAGEWSGRAAKLVLTLELAAAGLALLIARRRAPLALTVALFLVSAAVIAGAEDTAREAVRMIGWGGL
jgi:Family of unknown function (DUF6518)